MELTPEEIADIAAINAFRKPHTLAKFDLEGKSEAVIAAASAKKAEFDAAGEGDDGKDKDAPANVVDPDCVVMSKDSEEINVHPTQIAPWKAQGWTVAE